MQSQPIEDPTFGCSDYGFCQRSSQPPFDYKNGDVIVGGFELTVQDLVLRINDVVASGAGLVNVADRPYSDSRYFVDDAKLRALGRRPQISFEEGLKETFDSVRGA